MLITTCIVVDIVAEFSYPHAYEAGVGSLEDCAYLVMQTDTVRGAADQSTLEILLWTVIADRASGRRLAPCNFFDSLLHWIEPKILPGLSRIGHDIGSTEEKLTS